MRIAIIGAGIGGLAAARYTLAAGNHDVIVFEQSDCIGGNWAYKERPGADEYDLNVSSSAYPSLITNTPKEIMAYPDFPFPHRDGESSYMPASQVLTYIERFALHFRLNAVVRLRHQVVSVRPVPGTTRWSVTTRNVLTAVERTAEFDAVFVCNGHYSCAAWPENLPGRQLFRGRQMHSHTFRDSAEFRGRRVLIVGGGPSAQDVAWMVRSAAAKLCISAHGVDAESMTRTFGAAAVRTDVVALTPDGVRFAANGSTEERFDVIIYCTGYAYEFPFLHSDCGISVAFGSQVRPLFKQCVHADRPTMFMIGLTKRDVPFLVADVQARFAVALLQQKAQLPDRQQMERIMAADAERSWHHGKRNGHRIFEYFSDYISELEQLGGLERPTPPVVFKIFRFCEHRMMHEFSTFRRDKYTILDEDNFMVETVPLADCGTDANVQTNAIQ